MHALLLLTTLIPSADAACRDDAVLRWNAVVLDLIRADKTPPPQATRHLAMVHAAVYDAANAIYQSHSPYKVHLRATEPADPTAAVATAAHRVLISLYPCYVEELDGALAASIAAVPDGPDRTRGVQIGKYVAERILACRRCDGSTRQVAHPDSLDIGRWRRTPPGFKSALVPQWATLTPFSLPSLSEFRPKPPPPVTSAEFTADFNEVKRLGGRDCSCRTADQTVIARFWDDGEGTATPPGHWNVIAQTVARCQRTSLPENARLFALLNIALADAAICCWDCKYHYSYWRPVTAIHEAECDGNPDTHPDPCWSSLLTTPPFPTYTSGHSTFSGAASAVLAFYFGKDEVPFTVGSDGLRCVTRSYPGFWAAAQEAGRSRIYGGIHYQFDNREGLASGRALALRICGELLVPLSDETVRPAIWRRPRGPDRPGVTRVVNGASRP